MKVTFLDQKRITEQLKELMHSSDEYHWAVAWGTVNKLSDYLIANKAKIKRLTFGTHFYQSDPGLLEAFKDMDTVRVMPNDAPGTFHPKVYLFIKDSNAAAIVGSANFTSGAMNNNNEAAALIEGDSSDTTIQEIKALVQGAWADGEKIDQVFLDNYRLQHRATAEYRKALARQRKLVQPKSDALYRDLRQWTWEEFATKVRKDRYQYFDARLELLKEARELFAGVNGFSDMTDDEARAIAGFFPQGKSLPNRLANDWGLFGSMKGAGDFKNVILNRAKNRFISKALDHIPLIGDVTKDQYNIFIELFTQAFNEASRKGGVSTASRLLAIKRPDIFLCVNNKNKRGLSKDLGFASSTLTFDKYWHEIVVPITESVWWQCEKPEGKDGPLWEGRAAMLDSIYYLEPEQ